MQCWFHSSALDGPILFVFHCIVYVHEINDYTKNLVPQYDAHAPLTAVHSNSYKSYCIDAYPESANSFTFFLTDGVDPI